MNMKTAPCHIVEVDDAKARLLAQALNHLQGEDDFGLKAVMMEKILGSLSQKEVLEILPETAGSLQSLASLNQNTVAHYLQNWQDSQQSRLKHLIFHLTAAQFEIVVEALTQMIPEAKSGQFGNPNSRGTALYLLCKEFLRKEIKNK
jgi:ParB family chromosome partitioning protein